MKDKSRRIARKAHRADRKLSRTAAKARDTSPVRAAAAVGELADQPPLIALSAATALAGAALGNTRIARMGLRMLASHLLATAIKTGIKRSIDRTRPHAAHGGKRYRLEPGESRHHDLSSFPSGHTAGAVAVARAVAREMPQTAPLAATAAGAVAAIQLPNAKHYASDVAAGAVVGLASAWIVDTAFDLAERGARQVQASAAVRSSIRSVRSHGNSSPSALRPKWP